MRCEWCDYCHYDSFDGIWQCYLGIEETENKKGICGCKYNKKTLDKIQKRYWEEEVKYAQMCNFVGKDKKDD